MDEPDPANIGGGLNKLTGKIYSSQFFAMLKNRKQLPVWRQKEEFIGVFKKNQTMILEGDTGCGKSTQIPQFVIDALYDESSDMKKCMVGCTQPRRVAAVSVSSRVAAEMDVTIGEEVGYTIRFEDCTSPRTVLKYLTDGMLLREAMADPLLKRYKVIILDEAHERTLATDVLLGLLKKVLRARSDLKLVVMSATLEAKKFQEYLSGAPVMKVPGMLHGVEVFYSTEPVFNYLECAISTVVAIHTYGKPGDILLFLTGEEEIEEACMKIMKTVADLGDRVGPVRVLPLYSTLSLSLQKMVFEPAPQPVTEGGLAGRKIVVATNIAETSLTIEGIVYVVDPGLAKENVYNPISCVESLMVSLISKASAQQRLGRAGRTQQGKCYRLYTEKSFNNLLKPHTCPAILRSNLAGTVLTLKKLGISDLGKFEFMDRPARKTLMRALEVLEYLGAINDKGDLTATGRLISEFPLEPQMSKMLIVSPDFHCTEEILTLSAMLSVPNCFKRPREEAQKADRARGKFAVSHGDHFTLIKVYDEYKRNSEDSAWCDSNYINDSAMATVGHVRQQLLTIMSRLNLHSSTDSHSSSYDYTSIKKAIVSGYFMQTAYRRHTGEYSTRNDDADCFLHPSSCLVGNPKWVIFHEYVWTSKKFIRTVTKISPEWLLEIAPQYHNRPKSEANLFWSGSCTKLRASGYRGSSSQPYEARARNNRQAGVGYSCEEREVDERMELEEGTQDDSAGLKRMGNRAMKR
ncbi:DEAD/DEAH box helicase domain-containing protein [Hirschfeldia incana]|nr:DEAD/DEAH box helicase domain-containing protein [Hirschfeldia incana]